MKKIILLNLLAFIFIIIVFFISIENLKQNKIMKNFIFLNTQKLVYISSYRNIWQTKLDCVRYDNYLIYYPKNTPCKFNNPEFKTILNFDDYGRIQPNQELNGIEKNKKKIALLGDSFSMGWGVNDNETFAYLLEKKLKKRVYNFGVSSYATEREIHRFLQSGTANEVETVLLQYSENDFEENKKFHKANENEKKKFFNLLIEYDKNKSKSRSFVPEYMRYLKNIFNFNFLKKMFFKNLNFDDHRNNLVKIIESFEELDNKKIIIFYINSNGEKFDNYHENINSKNSNITFFDLNLQKKHYFALDDHLNSKGHKYAKDRLAEIVK